MLFHTYANSFQCNPPDELGLFCFGKRAWGVPLKYSVLYSPFSPLKKEYILLIRRRGDNAPLEKESRRNLLPRL